MPSLFRVEVDYSPRLSVGEKSLLALGSRLKDLRPLMKDQIAPVANRMLARWWDTEGGGTWAPLEPATIERKIRKGTLDRGILKDTEHLFKTLFKERAADSRLRVINGGLRLQLNIAVPYAIFHQLGTINMVARQVIPDPLPRSFIKEVKDLVRRYLLARAS